MNPCVTHYPFVLPYVSLSRTLTLFIHDVSYPYTKVSFDLPTFYFGKHGTLEYFWMKFYNTC